MIFFLLSLVFTLINQITAGEEYRIVLYEERVAWREWPVFPSTFLYYNEECKNLEPDWVNRVSSFTADTPCITLFTRSGCKGESKNFHTFTNTNEFLANYNFDKKTASFKKCEPDVEIQSNLRPIFYVETDVPPLIPPVRSGECRMLTKFEDGQDFYGIDQHCYILYNDTDCAGEKEYYIPSSSLNDDGLEQNFPSHYSNRFKSFRMCDLIFHPPCNHSCPRFLYNGSLEYSYWIQFFSISSSAYRKEFEQRVERSDNGFISWDFLFPTESSPVSLGDQYLDALINHWNIFRALRISQPGTMGFNERSMEELLLLSVRLRLERRDQKHSIQKNPSDHNFVILSYLQLYWERMEDLLDEIIQEWYPTTKNSDRSAGIKFHKLLQGVGAWIEYSYRSRGECVNLRPYWTRIATSISPNDQCVTVYSNANCTGDSENFHALSKGLDFMGEVNFGWRVASFKKCASKVKVKSNIRPQLYVSVLDRDENGEVFKIFSGDCLTLPRKWFGNAVLYANHQCYTVFDDVNCKGNKDYVVSQFKYYNRDMKSIKSCNLAFEGKCDPTCPKFLYKGSAEFDFWMYLFSITSRSNRDQFEARVSRSKDGFISWDFLFIASKNWTIRSSENMYRDALESQFDILRALFILSRPGKLSFNETSLEKLLLLATRVQQERSKQQESFNKNPDEHNFSIMVYFVDTWSKIESILDKVIQKWYPKRGNGKLPEIKFWKTPHNTESPEVEYWKNLQHPEDSISYAYGEKCVNLRPYWIIKARSITTTGPCVTLYTMANCRGGSKNFNPISTDSAREFNVNEVASFKRCEPIQLGDRLADRPKFQFTVVLYNSDSETFTDTILSGECRTLPEVWQSRRITVRTSTQQCYALFEGINCAGNVEYNVPEAWRRNRNYPHRRDDEYSGVKSIRTCGLVFRGPCKPSCPKFLYNGGPEFAFWLHFLTAFSPSRRKVFEERVKRSKDGFILWDFLLASNATVQYQYEDVLEISLASLSALSYDKGYLEKLLELISDVHKERNDQKLLMDRDGNYTAHDSAVLAQLNNFWHVMEKQLDEFIQKIFYGNEKNITFWDNSQEKGDSVTHTVNEKCVNLRTYWRNRATSLDVHDQCITLYSKVDCEGNSTSVYPRSKGHQHMGEINFDNRVASFRKCAPNLPVEMNARPIFHIVFYPKSMKPKIPDDSEVFSLKSDECRTIPKKWRTNLHSVAINKQCYNFFETENCTGKKRYHLAPEQSPSYNTPISSVKLFDPIFQPPCDRAACPKYLYTGSVEFNFWMYFFGVVSRSQRDQFRERVARSQNGFISWDFLFASNTSATSMGPQYLDALERQLNILSVLRVSRPGRFGFNRENLETLFALSVQVFEERDKQREMLDRVYDGHNFVVSWWFAELWSSIQRDLNETVEHWRNENNNEFCGRTGNKEYENLDETVPSLNEGSQAIYGDDPWHVALYKLGSKNSEPVLICGGSLISASVVLSAAHCFYDRGRKKLQTNASLYEIYGGKLKRDYNDAVEEEEEFKEKHQIEELVYHFNKYDPEGTGTYGADIVLIILKEPVTLNQYVHPICLDWDNSIFGTASNNLTIGRVVGWGSTNTDSEHPEYSEDLLTANLKYISRNDCVRKLRHLSIDNFCGGADDGPGTRKGDSGGGFVFKYENRYYIRGIVSTNDRDQKSSISAFTDVSSYISWIRNYV